MGDVAVSAVINKAVDIAATLIREESSRLYWLREDILWLEQQMRLMQAYLQVAEAKKIDKPTVATFIKGIRDLAHDVEDIFDIFLPQIEEHKSSGLLMRMACILPYSVTCCNFSREIEKIRKRVQSIEENKKIYDIPDINIGEVIDEPNVDPRTTMLHFDDDIIVGFDRDIAELKSKLDDHQFVSVIGMAGLGKTTLAKKVFKSVKNNFDCSASVSVSQEPNVKILLQQIAKQVGLHEEKLQEENLGVNLYSFLQRKRYVLFLDDIWRTEAWDCLKLYFPINSESPSRIIITSRNTGVGRYIGGLNSVHQLYPFDYPTSWELFSKLINPSLELKEIGKEIVKKCGGVPLAIVVIVGMLRERGNNEFGWKEILKSIGRDAHDKCSQILGLSYMDLPIVLKPCFLYLGNFPEDYEFLASKLIKLWMAEKFIRSVGAREPEDVGDDYLSKLDSRNLIQVVKREYDGRVKKFRVHDLLHSLCISIGREIDFLSTIDHLDDEASFALRVRRLAVFEDVSLDCNTPKIRELFHFKIERKIQEKLKIMVSMFRLLHVLKIETSRDLFLPTGIQNLNRLNYLGLKSKGCVDIPSSIQSLEKLETLDVDCFAVRLPPGIWMMEQLRHLMLRPRGVFSVFIKSDWSLSLLRFRQAEDSSSNIRTLLVSFCPGFHPRILLKLNNLRKLMLEWITPETMQLICGRSISRKLEILHCSSRGLLGIRRLSFVQYDMLAELKLYNFRVQMPIELPTSLIKLTLVGIYLAEETILRQTLKNLPKLKILKLSRSPNISRMDLSGDNSFPELQVLKLVNLYNLIDLGEDIRMPKLRSVIIKHCPNLEKIPERFLQLLRGSSQMEST